MTGTIVNYLRTLVYAIIGHDPFAAKLDSLEKVNKKAQNMLDVAESALARLQEESQKLAARVGDYQNLTENLRQRITDKDVEIEALQCDLRNRTEENKRILAELRGKLLTSEEKLAKAEKDLGREMMNANLLSKTNNALADICEAMSSENTDSMLAVTEQLEWSSHLTQIVQRHLNVLRRKNELEKRIAEK